MEVRFWNLDGCKGVLSPHFIEKMETKSQYPPCNPKSHSFYPYTPSSPLDQVPTILHLARLSTRISWLKITTWVTDIAKIGQSFRQEAQHIFTKYTTYECKKTIKNVDTLLILNPKKKKHKRIIQPHDSIFLDCIQGPQGNIVIHPGNKIYQIQKISFQRQVPLSLDTRNHLIDCTYVVHHYPCHYYDNGFTLSNHCLDPPPISSQFYQNVYDDCLKHPC